MASSNPIECNTDTINAFTDCLRGDNGLQVGTKEDSSSDTNYVVNFCQNGVEEQSLLYDSELSYNPADATLTSGVLRAIAPTASNEPSMTLAFASDIGRIEARGSDASTVADMQFYVASEAFEVSHNPLNLRGSNGFVGIGLTNPTYKLDVYDTTSFECKTAVRSLDQTLEISSYYEAGVGQYSYLQSRQEANPGITSNLVLNPFGGNIGIGISNPTVSLDINGTDALKLPSGTTAERPTPQNGMIRYNEDDNDFEGYKNGSWDSVGASGGSFEFIQTDSVIEYVLTLNTPSPISALTVSITPKSTSSVIRLESNIFGEFSSFNATYEHNVLIGRSINGGATTYLRNSNTSAVSRGITSFATNYHDDDNNSTAEVCAMVYYDQPNTTLPTTYTVYIQTGLSGISFVLNRVVQNTTLVNFEYGVSSMSASDGAGIASSPSASVDSIEVIDETANTSFPVLFTDSAGIDRTLRVDTSTDGLTFNPSTSTLSGLTTISNTSNLSLNPSGGLLGIGRTDPVKELDVLFTTPTTGTSQDTVSALFQTTVGGIGGKHGVGIGGDVITGNGFLQSTYGDGLSGYNLLLQPIAGNVGVGLNNPTYKLDVYDTTSFECKTATRSFDQTLEISSYYQAGVGQYSYLQSRQEANPGITRDLLLNPSGGNIGMGSTSNPTSALQISQGPNTRASIDGLNVYWNCDHTTDNIGSLFYNCQVNGVTIGKIRQSTTTSVAYDQMSDYRLKENVVEMPGMLERVKQLRPVQFNYLRDSQDSLGFIAHEIKEVFPNNAIVRGEKDAMMNVCTKCNRDEEGCKCEEPDFQSKPDYQSMDYGMLTPILVKAVQELAGENQELRSELAAVQAQYSALLERVTKLESV